MSKTRAAIAHQGEPAFKHVERIGYSIAEAAAKLSVSGRHLRRLIDKGEFPQPIRVGGRSIVLAADLDGYVAGRVREREGGKR